MVTEHLYILKRLEEKAKKIEDKKLMEKIQKLLKEMHGSVSLIYEQAIHDKKTGLYNNHFFETILNMEIDKANRNHINENKNLCILMLDLDFFKKVNDAHGHLVGDRILERFAKIIKSCLRKSDVAARFGGEEFIVLLPQTTIEKTEKIAKRIKASLKKDYLMKEYKITASGGITKYHKGDTSQKLIHRVDKALYEAKNKGRDRFIIVK